MGKPHSFPRNLRVLGHFRALLDRRLADISKGKERVLVLVRGWDNRTVACFGGIHSRSSPLLRRSSRLGSIPPTGTFAASLHVRGMHPGRAGSGSTSRSRCRKQQETLWQADTSLPCCVHRAGSGHRFRNGSRRRHPGEFRRCRKPKSDEPFREPRIPICSREFPAPARGNGLLAGGGRRFHRSVSVSC